VIGVFAGCGIKVRVNGPIVRMMLKSGVHVCDLTHVRILCEEVATNVEPANPPLGCAFLPRLTCTEIQHLDLNAYFTLERGIL
jgi:hypothetical protein